MPRKIIGVSIRQRHASMDNAARCKRGDNEINLYAPNKFMKEEIESQFMSKISEVMGTLSNEYSTNLDVSSSQVNKKGKNNTPRI